MNILKKNSNTNLFILIDLWLIIPLRYREWVEKKNPPVGGLFFTSYFLNIHLFEPE